MSGYVAFLTGLLFAAGYGFVLGALFGVVFG